MDASKKKALDAALLKIEKEYGKGAMMKMSESSAVEVEAISTGSLNLDLALGVGGLPRGRIIEIYGPEASGKSTLAMACVKEVQENGGIAAYIDAEHAMDIKYATRMGINVGDLYLSQPDSGEQALNICETIVRSGAVDLVVIDSVAALTPQAEIDGEMEDQLVGVQARMMSKACRKLTSAISSSRCVVIFINQLREKVGVMYGNPEVTPGGKALKFYSSVRLDVRRVEALKKGPDVIGNHVRVKVVKNKVAPPFRQAEFDIIFGQGIDKDAEVVDAALTLGFIVRSGAWFSYENTETNRKERWQGKERVKEALSKDADLMKEIKELVINKLHEPAVVADMGNDDVDPMDD